MQSRQQGHSIPSTSAKAFAADQDHFYFERCGGRLRAKAAETQKKIATTKLRRRAPPRRDDAAVNRVAASTQGTTTGAAPC
jgi:hypothetical protein